MKITSYQQRKKEIRELKKVVSELEDRLKENGIEFGQLSIPSPPLDIIIRTSTKSVFCPICHSTMSRRGYLGLFGQRKCDNKECKNSK